MILTYYTNNLSIDYLDIHELKRLKVTEVLAWENIELGATVQADVRARSVRSNDLDITIYVSQLQLLLPS